MPRIEHPAPTRNRVRPFKLSERRIWPGCIEVEVEGELDLAVSDRLRKALDAARESPCHVLVGLGACDFIDSSGLAVPVAEETGPGADFSVTLANGGSARLRRSGSAAP